MSMSNAMRSTSRAARPAALRGRTGTTKRAAATARVNDLATLITGGRVLAGAHLPELAELRKRVSSTRSVRVKKALATYRKRLEASRAATRVLASEVMRLAPELDLSPATLNVFLLDMLLPDQISGPHANTREGRADGPRKSTALRPVDNSAVLASARQAGETFKAKVLAQPDMLSAKDAAARVHKSRQTINDQRLAGKLIGLSFGSDRFRYPQWQFHDNVYGKPLEATLAALGDADAWEKWRFFTSEDGMLAGKVPSEVMRSGELPLDRITRAAKAFAGR